MSRLGGHAGRLAHTKDLLDSRSLVYYSLTLTIYDSLAVYARCCIRPIASYPQGGGTNHVKITFPPMGNELDLAGINQLDEPPGAHSGGMRLPM